MSDLSPPTIPSPSPNPSQEEPITAPASAISAPEETPVACEFQGTAAANAAPQRATTIPLSKFTPEELESAQRLSNKLRQYGIPWVGSQITVVESMITELAGLHGIISQIEGKLVWKTHLSTTPVNFITEVCTFMHGGAVYILGPKDEHVLLMMRMDLQSQPPQAIAITMEGEYPKPAHCFKRMPNLFMLGGIPHLGFPGPNGDYEIWTVNPVPGEGRATMTKVNTKGAPLTETGAETWQYDGGLYLLYHGWMWKLDLQTWHWERMGDTPIIPGNAISGGCSNLVHQGKFCVLKPDGTAVKLTDPTTWEVTERPLVGGPTLALKDHHLLREYRGWWYLLRKVDLHELWRVNLESGRWERLKAYGKRPGAVNTNPSYFFVGSRLFCLSDQICAMPRPPATPENPNPKVPFKSMENEILCLDLAPLPMEGGAGAGSQSRNLEVASA